MRKEFEAYLRVKEFMEKTTMMRSILLELTNIQWYHVDQVTLVSIACDIQTQPFIY